MCQDHRIAEEVTQETFLYLMTALPDLETELDVIRFAQWKAKQLSLDFLRVSKRTTESLDETEASPDLDLAESLERAEEASIVRHALAKVPLRQREALLAQVFEEKSNAEIAVQLDMSQNSVRQLLLRARKSFKVSFGRELSLRGMSISDGLALSSRSSVLRNLTAGLAVIVLGLSSFLLSNPAFQPLTTVAAGIPGFEASAESRFENLKANRGELGNPQDGKDFNVTREGTNLIADFDSGATGLDGEKTTEFEVSTPDETETNGTDENSLKLGEPSVEMAMIFDEDYVDKLGDQTEPLSFGLEGNQIVIEASENLTIYLWMGAESESRIQHSLFVVTFEGYSFYAVPQATVETASLSDSGELMLNYGATDFLIGDFGGVFENATVDNAELSFAKILITIWLDPEQRPAGTRVETVNSSNRS